VDKLKNLKIGSLIAAYGYLFDKNKVAIGVVTSISSTKDKFTVKWHDLDRPLEHKITQIDLKILSDEEVTLLALSGDMAQIGDI